MEQNNVDLDRDYTLSDLEKLEDLVYNIMMSHMDENGDYTELAEKYEKIIDVIVKIVILYYLVKNVKVFYFVVRGFEL